MTHLEQIRALYKGLSMADQLAVMCDLIQAGHPDIRRSTAFSDALFDLDRVFDEAYAEADCAAEPWEHVR